MTSLRYVAITAGLLLAGTAEVSRANDFGHPGGGGLSSTPTTLAGSHAGGQFRARLQNFNLFHKPNLPVYQAAPWYNYWPYDGHFLTPAPISGPFYGPPLTGNFPVNPYFPGPAMPVGPMPGGPPPGHGGR